MILFVTPEYFKSIVIYTPVIVEIVKDDRMGGGLIGYILRID